MEFYSHREPRKIVLSEHLKYVGDRSKAIMQSKRLRQIDNGILADISYLIGISHDFGKYTTFFQEKLRKSRDAKDLLTYHSLISALFTFEVVNEYIKGKNLEEKEPYKFLPLIACFVAKHHHGKLDNIKDSLNQKKLFDSGFKKVGEQLGNIWTNKNKIIREYAFLLQDYDIVPEKIFKNLEKYKEKVISSNHIKSLEEIEKLLYFLNKQRNIIYYLVILLLYSVLIDSDKKHAGHVRNIERKNLPINLVYDYLNSQRFKKNNKSKINKIRNEIRKTVLEKIKSVLISKKVFTITAPTGTGKTLTSLSAALILRKRLQKELSLKYEPRIIYSLPFTSIIDQNFDVFDDVLRSSGIADFKENESQYIIKHHYLSDIFYKTKDISKEKDLGESLALIESWESEIIVTTFLQLFYTLIGYRNRSLKKFHNIVNSIMILDEVQNIPIKYWPVIRKVLIEISNYFNCRIILMTATKPLIFEEEEYIELLDDYETYFKRDELNRVILNIDFQKRTIREFCNNLSDWSKNSYLFVFNTIQSSLDFYDAIKEKIDKQKLSFKVYCLTTNIIPKERKNRIEDIKKALNSREKIIIVSTQLIEAGVNIDCDCVYRDIGPLDSIIQVAGRCNRNKRFELASVFILNLIKENYRSFTGIYGHNLIEITKKIFEKKIKIKEKDFPQLINTYFQKTKEQSHLEKEIINSLYELYFYDKDLNQRERTPISEFKLIEDAEYKVDVFVEFDEQAKEVMKKYIKIINNENLKPFEKKNMFLKIKPLFYSYIISVNTTKINEGFLPTISQNFDSPFDINTYYLQNNILEKYYNKETGFFTKEGLFL